MSFNLRRLLALDDSALIKYKLNIAPAVVRQILIDASRVNGTSVFNKRFILRFKTEQKFLLTRISNRNSWRRTLNGSLQADGNGTVLTGSFKVSSFVLVFSTLWLFMTAAIAGALIISEGTSGIFGLIFPFVGLALVYISRFATFNDERAVIKLLDKAFENQMTQKETPGY